MSHIVCENCKGWIFSHQKECTKCAFNKKHNIRPHDCKVDGHVSKGLIASFACKYCNYHGELTLELQPSEAELAIMGGVSPYTRYEDDDY